jgi:hypothetical protein
VSELRLPADPQDFLFKGIWQVVIQKKFHTQFIQLTIQNNQQVDKNNWVFDWSQELKNSNRRVYKLVTQIDPQSIQALISLSIDQGFVFVHLLENAPLNRGKDKKFEGVVGNLFAFASLLSIQAGFDGFVAFDSKTELMPYYQKNYGAIRIGGIRMALDEQAARRLIDQYYHLPL